MSIIKIFVLVSEINAFETRQFHTVGYCFPRELEYDSEGRLLGQYFLVTKQL